jgi:hypothetical protein
VVFLYWYQWSVHSEVVDFGICTFWVLEVDIYILFCSLRRGYYTEKFFCSYVEILIQKAGVRSSLIWWNICWVMGLISVRPHHHPPKTVEPLACHYMRNAWATSH